MDQPVHNSASQNSSSNFAFLQTCLLNAGVGREQIIDKTSSKYESLNYQWNTIHGLILPLAYLLVQRVQDVQAAIRCCETANVRPVARSGGHSFAKYGYGDSMSLVIDLQDLNQVEVDKESRTAWIDAGARVGRDRKSVV